MYYTESETTTNRFLIVADDILIYMIVVAGGKTQTADWNLSWFDPVMLITKLQSVANLQAKEGGNACGKSLKKWVKMVVHLPATFSREELKQKEGSNESKERVATCCNERER